MNSKIIGFVITKAENKFSLNLNPEVRSYNFQVNNYSITLYFIGENIEECSINNKSFSLGFPANDSLLDRNLIISFNNNTIIIENDWLGSIPVYYNETDKIISNFPNICLKDKTYDPEGLYNYLKYGFSVFHHTPFIGVKFLPFYSKLTIAEDCFNIVRKEDPIHNYKFNNKINTKDIINSTRKYVQNVEDKIEGEIILPISGGYDSRLLAHLVKDKERIRSYTYGVSKDQTKSNEVVKAKEIAKRFGFNWENIKLENSFDFIKEWHNIYGFSTHLHGMYHIEFYKKILAGELSANKNLLSGIVGDAWAGSINYSQISRPEQLYQLSYNHNITCNPFGHAPTNNQQIEYFEDNQYLLSDIRLYPIITVRLKLALLNYLQIIPEAQGIPSWSPFLNFDIAMKMLSLPQEERYLRKWQTKYFYENNLIPRHSPFSADTRNVVNRLLFFNAKLEPLKEFNYLDYIPSDQINWINKIFIKNNPLEYINYRATTTRIIKEVLKKLGHGNLFNSRLSQYQILKALEMSLDS